MLFIALAVSAVFLVIVNAIAFFRERTGVGVASLCSLGAIFVLFFCMTLVLPLNALLVAVAGGVCWAVTARPRWFLASSLVATAAAYLLIALPDLLAWNQLKKEYPLESLAGRLDYENQPRPASFPGRVVPAAPNAAARNADRLAHLEERFQKEELHWENWSRVLSLQHLHAGVVKQFVDSDGFGVGRRIVRPGTVHLMRKPVEAPIPQPIPPYSPPDVSHAPVRVAFRPDLLTAHDDNMVDFLNPFRFGYVRDREHVAGFRPHQFRNEPRAPAPERWKVGRLELVGLLKFDEPVVYLSSNLPRMDELSKAPTRPLDAFEKKAMGGLLGGEDLMMQEDKQRCAFSARSGPCSSASAAIASSAATCSAPSPTRCCPNRSPNLGEGLSGMGFTVRRRPMFGYLAAAQRTPSTTCLRPNAVSSERRSCPSSV